jgi:hypothetical protein
MPHPSKSLRFFALSIGQAPNQVHWTLLKRSVNAETSNGLFLTLIGCNIYRDFSKFILLQIRLVINSFDGALYISPSQERRLIIAWSMVSDPNEPVPPPFLRCVNIFLFQFKIACICFIPSGGINRFIGFNIK